MRRQIDIPDILFHVTRKEYVKDILNEGLIPNKNKVARFDDESNSENDERFGSYLTSDHDTLLGIDSSFNEEEYSLLSINVEGIKEMLIPDNAFDGLEDSFTDEEIEDGLYDQFCWYTKNIIDKKYIKHIGNLKRVNNNFILSKI